MIKQILILGILVLSMAGTAAAGQGMSIESAKYENGIFSFSASSADEDISNAKVRMCIPELGIVMPAKTVDLKEDKSSNALFAMDEMPEGEYLVRMTVSKNGKSRVVHRFVMFE